MDSEGTRVWVQQTAIENLKANNAPSSFKPNKSLRSSSSTLQGSFHGSLNTSLASFAESDSSFTDASASSNSRHSHWGWRSGYLVEADQKGVVVKIDAPVDDAKDAPGTLSLAPTAIKDGVVVLSNDYPYNQEGLIQPPHDLITLTHLHEPAVVESLQHRYAMDQIYTSTGPVLLALNPFQSIRGLYGESMMKKYFDRGERNTTTELPPHVYAIADSSYRNMMRKLEENLEDATGLMKANQSILVSGESGAGKTVSTKILMKYLAALSQRSTVLHVPEKRAYLKVQEANAGKNGRLPTSKSRGYTQPSWSSVGSKMNTVPTWRKSANGTVGQNDTDSNILSSVSYMSNDSSIEAQVLQSNPILESFGNARTVRNDNSSRFGKFIEIQFTRSGKLVGAKIDTYLLEKVRLVAQSSGERNYHIFYELLYGDMDLKERNALFLTRAAAPQDFKMTARGTYDRRDGVSDRETYRMLRQAFQTMKFSNDDAREVLSLAAAILHASNLTFQELAEDTCTLETKNAHLPPVCDLFGVSSEDLNEALCSYTIKAGTTVLKRSLDKERAYKSLQGLLKSTYGALFECLVKRINDSIAFKEAQEEMHEQVEGAASHAVECRPAASIGILDIFGFESFTRNSFEQLCINYCNEALQQQFNAFVLKNEQAEYEREGIEWSFIEFPENQDVLDLLERRGTGVLSILDDQCRAPGPSDKGFALSLYNACKGQSRFICTRKQQANLQFSVLHYAGPVAYTAEGFVEKNRDELPKESIQLLRNSRASFVQHIASFMELTQAEQTSVTDPRKPPTPAKINRADSVVGRATVSEQFKRQLKILRQKIDLTTPHFVRCLKPNDSLVPDTFEHAVVADQLRCGGILEAVRVARAGFTQHYPHWDFVRRYRALAWKEMGKRTAINSPSNFQFSRWNSRGRGNGHKIPYGAKRASPAKATSRPRPDAGVPMPDAELVCRDLIKILYRKLVSLEQIEDSAAAKDSGIADATHEDPRPASTAEPIPSVTLYRDKSDAAVVEGRPSRPPPLKLSDDQPVTRRYTPWEKPRKVEAPRSAPPSTPTSWKKGGPTASDFARVGIQLGKTKVFLRHQAFEALERIRSSEQARAATKLNAVFRRYLARLAYIPARNALRREFREQMQLDGEDMGLEAGDAARGDGGADFAEYVARGRLASLRLSFQAGDHGFGASLVDRWCESQIRNAIHNPVPRHQWGKQAPSKESTFKWVIKDGLWVKNYNWVPCEETEA